MRSIMLLPAVLLGSAALCGSTALLAAPPNAGTPELNLPSWNEGASKQAIMEFVGKVTRLGGPDYVPPAERIAAFDNDGTLWAEQPLHPQLVFALDRVKALSPQHPEWTTTEPFASVVKGDIGGALAGGEPAIFQIVTATRAGLTTGEFENVVRDWIATAKHPKTGRLYSEMVYQPMLELLAYLRATGLSEPHHRAQRLQAGHGRLRGQESMVRQCARPMTARCLRCKSDDRASSTNTASLPSQLGRATGEKPSIRSQHEIAVKGGVEFSLMSPVPQKSGREGQKCFRSNGLRLRFLSQKCPLAP